jgi:6-phosphofructo-2-kinase/fructose-2,6-biphosphatase 2/6-phosphofructo-2-kinase/fructose-2,6-biphosphatase 4
MELNDVETKIILGLCGLPARGKTYLSRKVTRYLTWLGYQAKTFNIGNYRRMFCGTSNCTAEFFDPKNEEFVKARNECAELALKDLGEWLAAGGQVAIYDGTNTTKDRRLFVKNYIAENFKNCELLWIESICTDESIIEQNIKLTKLSSPDYVGINSEAATADFRNRIEKYKAAYQTVSTELDGNDVEFIKVFDVGKKIVIHNIRGYLQSKIISFLMNLHNTPRPIYFSRHGESLFNVEDKVGGDPDLSDKGKKYATELAKWVKVEKEYGEMKNWPDVKIFTSTLLRAVTTSNTLDIGVKPMYLKLLDEINVGICDGMTYAQIEKTLPLVHKERNEDKLKYRYPRGESYIDVIHRIEPIIFEIERSKVPVVVIAHQAVLRCLYAYFSKHEIPEVPHIDMPLHTVVRLLPETYSCSESRFNCDINTGTWTEIIVQKPLMIEEFRLDKDDNGNVIFSPTKKGAKFGTPNNLPTSNIKLMKRNLSTFC